MVRWRYRGTTVFFVGVLLAALAFVAVTGGALLQDSGRRVSIERETILSGDFLVRDPGSDPFTGVGDDAAGIRPLADAPACLAFLRSHPAVARVLPFSLAVIDLKSSASGKILLREMEAVALADDAWLLCRARLAPGSAGLFPGSAGLPLSLGGGIVLDEKILERVRNGGGATPASDNVFFVDRPGARDPFNLAAVTLAGSYTIPGGGSDRAPDPVCFVSPETLLKAAWRSVTDPRPSASSGSPPANRAPAPAQPGFAERIGPGSPLDYPFLFSLSSPADHSAETPFVIFPDYLLVSLNPRETDRRDAVLAELKETLERRGFRAAIEPWDPSRNPAGPRQPSLPGRFAGVLAAALLALIVLANAALRPVLSEVLAEDQEDEPGGGFGLGSWRPSFIARSFGIAFFSGAIGTLLALGTILAYNRLAPAFIRDRLGTFPGTGSGPVGVSWPSVGLAAAGIVLFAILTVIGPRLRAKKIVRTLNAPPAADERATDNTDNNR